MTDPAQAENKSIKQASPALARLLSNLGRRASFPRDIPFQAAEARGKAFNASIGQVTDGAGAPLALSPMADAVSGLCAADRNQAFLYSPIAGVAELRQAWHEWQRRGVEARLPSSLPVVTVGLTHGLSLIADLFGGEGRVVALASPFWGNYRQTFETRTGARIVSAPAYRDQRFNGRALAEAFAGDRSSDPAVAILNAPSNPGGYMPTELEREETLGALLEVAETRPLLVVCDDAYAGLVYEPAIPTRSFFWDLLDLHPNLVPVKLDGGTKEFSFFGGRVGFVTFPYAPESPAALALESKVKCLSRATVGSPVAISQIVLLQALRQTGIEAQIEKVRCTLEGRYKALRSALAKADSSLIRPMPFNSGCFALLELPAELDGVTANQVRRHLLDRHDTGLVSVGAEYLRIAFCSVKRDAIEELVRRIERGLAELLETNSDQKKK